ncbi:MAG: hypothetical protein K2N86_00760 [Rikenellaceae bacterium]|nr:hypothetical protein [Rikenellaceae bacterium]MDE7356174.1 hypothetical protein [Rikenellaceae bacterium]
MDNEKNMFRRLVSLPDASKASGLSELQIQGLIRGGTIGHWLKDNKTHVDFIELTIWSHRNDARYKRMLMPVDNRG